MSQDVDTFTEPSFVPRTVVPQKFETPDEYLSFLKENDLTSLDPSAPTNRGLARRSQITDKLNELEHPQARVMTDVSRNIYFWDFNSDGSTFPKILTRSKVVISDYTIKPTQVNHSETIQLITPKKTVVQKTQQHQTKTQQHVQVEEEDIFADAGTDYVLQVDASYKTVKIQQDDQVDQEIQEQEFVLEDGNRKRASEMVDTDMMDLDLDEIEFSNLQGMAQSKKKLKTRSDFVSDEAWRSYEETQSHMLASSLMSSFEEKKPQRGRGGYRGARGSQRGARSGKKGDKLDRQLEAVDKVYQQKYGSGLK